MHIQFPSQVTGTAVAKSQTSVLASPQATEHRMCTWGLKYSAHLIELWSGHKGLLGVRGSSRGGGWTAAPPNHPAPQLHASTFLWAFPSYLQFGSVQFSQSVVSDSLRPHESQHARPPCPSPTPRVHSNSRPSSQWCHPAISSSVILFSFCPQSLPASESFPMSQLFAWGC